MNGAFQQGHLTLFHHSTIPSFLLAHISRAFARHIPIRHPSTAARPAAAGLALPGTRYPACSGIALSVGRTVIGEPCEWMTNGSRLSAVLVALVLLCAGCSTSKVLPGRLSPGRSDLQLARPLAAGDSQSNPAIVEIPGGSTLVVWQEGWTGLGGKCAIRGCAMENGAPTNFFKISSEDDINERPAAALSRATDRVLVAWQTLSAGKQYDIVGVLLDRQGNRISDEIILARSPANDVQPALASDGNGFLLTWQTYAEASHGYAPMAARISADGEILDRQPMRLAPSAANARPSFNGKDYAVTYNSRDSVWIKRISVHGFEIDEEPDKPSSLMAVAPAIASDGKDFLVLAGAVPRPNPWGWHGPANITAGRLTSAGETPERELNRPLDFVKTADNGAPNILDRARWKGSKGWPATWRGDFPGTQNGTWPTPPVALATVAGDGYLAVWTRARISSFDPCVLTDRELWGAHVSSESTQMLGAPFPVATGPGIRTNPVAAPCGDDMLVVYEAPGTEGQTEIRYAFVKREAKP